MKTSKIAEKIQKLLNLAESSNENEARLASEKANELLVKYNLSRNDVEADALDYGYHSVYTAKRTLVEDKFINHILGTCFFVVAYYNRESIYQVELNDGTTIDISEIDFMDKMQELNAENKITGFVKISDNKYKFPNGNVKRSSVQTLQFYGERFNCEIAEYTYAFLMYQFKTLWKQEKKKHGYTEKDRQAYYKGLAFGICDQLQARKEKVQEETGLIVVEDKRLQMMFAKDNPDTSYVSYKTGGSDAAYYQGVEHGKSMQIRSGVKQGSATQSGKYIG